MDLQKVKHDIQTKELDSVYLFVGEEVGVMDIYINQMGKVLGYEVKHMDSVADVYKQCKKKSFIQIPYVYVVSNDKEYINNDKAQQAIESTLGLNKLVLVYDKLDKRSKYYKANKDNIVEVEPLKTEILAKYIMRECPLSQHRAVYLAEITRYYYQAMNEVDKINKLVKSLNISADDAFKQLLDERCIYVPPQDAIFDFVKAVLLRDVEASYYYLDEMKRLGEAPLIISSVLYNNTKQVLQVQSYHGNDLAKSTGLTGWQIRNAKELCGNYANGELVHMMEICRDCEYNIKVGKIAPELIADYILVNCL